MSTTRDRTAREQGATIVEFALVAPILLLLVFGLFELARLGYAFSEVRTAARDGARYATVVGDSDGDGVPNYVDCDAIEAATLELVIVESVTDADVDIEYYQGPTLVADCQPGGAPPPDDYSVELESGTEVHVTVRASFDSVVPFLEQFFEGITMDNTQIRTINFGLLG